MYLPRKIDSELNLWKAQKGRKPLLLRGARQVGKSSAVRHLGSSFEHFVEVNFDENPDYALLFGQNLSPSEICEQLSVMFKTPIIPGKTLLFFDEIQACIPAISSIRYFYEKLPDLHLIAAGSLLEFALADLPSFGVGRIRSLFMYPFSFDEFLNASGESLLSEMIAKASFELPLTSLLHEKSLRLFQKYLVIGGMPEVVSSYLLQNDLLEVQRILNDLIISLEDDFAKYKRFVSGSRIRQVFNAVVDQIGTKFTYAYPNSTLSTVQVKEALELLSMAGLIFPVIHSSGNGHPLGAEANLKKRKFLILDTGIFQRILGLNISEIMLEKEFSLVNKGNIAELFVGLELLKNSSPYEKMQLYYWHREARNSQAEIDYLIQVDDRIVPIEVKSGSKGSMKSLHLFLNEKKVEKGLRISMENYSQLDQIDILPLYAVKSVFS